MERVKYLEDNAREIRKLTIESIGKLGVGHIGGCMSICEVLSVLYFDAMKIDPKNPMKKMVGFIDGMREITVYH